MLQIDFSGVFSKHYLLPFLVSTAFVVVSQVACLGVTVVCVGEALIFWK